MKTSSILLIALFLLFPWCAASLIAQTTDETTVEKKIIIIKKTFDADGSEVTETIVKKGKAAENFDVDKFVRENKDDKTEVEVIVKDVNSPRFPGLDRLNNMAWPLCNDGSGAFLGVEEDSDEDAAEPGLVVQIVRGSAAEKAGLRHNDKIIQLNTTKINEWDDLTQVIQAAKPGDQMKVTYTRNGKEATANVTLTTRKDLKCDEEIAKKGFLGVSGMDEREGKGLEVSIVDGSGAEKAGLQDGDVLLKLNETPIADFEDVSDFMAYTKPGDKVLVAYERNGKLNTTEAVLSEQKTDNWNGGNIHIQAPEINLRGLGNIQNNLVACTIKEKEACLGVYSNDQDEAGAEIQGFTDESAAREVGMQNGDLILSVNGQKVSGHNELWNEIAKYKAGEKVEVNYLREGEAMNVKATLKACKDNLKKVDIKNTDDNDHRSFYLWNWGDADDRRQYKETRIIIIRRAGEGDAAKLNVSPNQAPVESRSLALQGFRAFPNPSQGQVTVEFNGEPVSTVVSLLDISGRQLFREELNAFNGQYSQQFDLTAYAKGTIIIHVQQGDQVYTEQIVVN